MARRNEKSTLIIHRYHDSRPEDSWVDPSVYDEKAKLEKTFSKKQRVIISKLLQAREIPTTKVNLRVNLKTFYHEFRSPHHTAYQTLECIAPNGNTIELTNHSADDKVGCNALENPAYWVVPEDISEPGGKKEQIIKINRRTQVSNR